MSPTKREISQDDHSAHHKQHGHNSQRHHRGGRRFNGGGNRNGVGSNKEEVAPPPGFKPRTESEMSEDEGACHVCLNKMTVYSVGECNHPICYVCSTRMRVLCNQNECATCRRDLPKVVFTSEELKYEVIKDNIYPMDRKFKICFETEEIQNAYSELLDHRCPVCTEEKVIFRTFRQLDQHVRREHESYFCDLCVNHLKLFSHERKLYSRKLLVEHRRKGDADDTSFKGHPLCEFCEQRHIDKDELFKHLRKDHYFCHFCDADGHQYFFSEYPDLRDHFAKDHYLCQEPECEETKFVVFRTEIDLKGHRLERHSGALSKAASKETRKVELEFSYSSKREERAERGGRGERGGRYRGRDHGRSETPESGYVDQLDGPVRQNTEQVPDFTADFPTLSSETSTNALSGGKSGELAKKLAQTTGHNTGQTWSNKGGSIKVKDEEFPSLPGARPGAPPPSKTSYAPNIGSRNGKKETPTVQKKSRTEEFPGLPSSSKPLPKHSNQFKTVKPVNQPKAANKVRPSEPTKSNKPPGMRIIDARIKDDSDDDISRHEEPSLDLNHFSRLTVKDSGQDLSYTSSNVGSNIMTIDRKVLEAQTGSNNYTNSSTSNKANLANENFPGLGAPERTLNLNSGAGKKNKNKNKAKENNNNINKTRTNNLNIREDNSSLSSICDFLGGSDKKPVHKEPAKPPDVAKEKKVKKTEEKKVKPIASKSAIDDQLYRPSKEKKVEMKPKEVLTKQESRLEDDFPSLGGNSKKLSANFVKKEDKLIKQPQVNSKWNTTESESKKNLLQSTDLMTENTKSKNVPSVPPGFGVEKPKAKSKTPPGFGNKLANNFTRDSKLKYSPPANFQERNHKLISTIASLVGGKSLEFTIFKDISGQFRAGKLSSDNYFSQCRELVSKDKFVKFFPELLVLLPDIDKQLELLSLYSKQDQDKQLVKCPVCGQVCLIKDREDHGSSHELDDDFPQL